MSTQSLLDIAQQNGNDAVVGLIEENLTYAPELSVIPARTIKGTSYYTGIRTAYPSVGFRNANESTTAGKSTFKKTLFECYILSSIIQVDKAVAKAHEDGEDAWKAVEASGVMKQALIELGSQVFYGTSVDAKGFPGLQAIVDSSMVADAGGTTATTGSSVYAVRTGIRDVQMLFGSNSTFTLSDFREETLSGIPSFVADLTAWAGMQVGHKYAVGRLRDATEDSGLGVTDAQIAKLLEKFPVGNKPDVLFMNPRSLRQLQASRSAVSNQAYAAGAWAPPPVESNGVRIVVTDSITNTETLS